jgi:hypothetical protein
MGRAGADIGAEHFPHRTSCGGDGVTSVERMAGGDRTLQSPGGDLSPAGCYRELLNCRSFVQNPDSKEEMRPPPGTRTRAAVFSS